MDTALLLTRLILAGIFLVAGIAKLADRTGSSDAMEGFGVPARLAAPMGALLPVVEIAIAALLLPASTARWGALGALALLLVFIGGIGYNLARGNQPDCHCFGQLHSEPAGWPTIARNTALALTAGFVAWRGWDDAGPSPLAWAGELDGFERATVASVAILTVLVAIEGWGLLHLMRQNGRLMLRLDALGVGSPRATPATRPKINAELPIGSPAPPFALPDLDGASVTLADLAAHGRQVLLVFVSTSCHVCAELLPEIAQWQRDHADRVTLAIISRGDADAGRAKTAPHGIAHVLVEETSDVAKAYGLNGRPTAVLVTPDLTIGSPLGEKAEGIRRLVQRTLAASEQAGPAASDSANRLTGEIDMLRSSAILRG